MPSEIIREVFSYIIIDSNKVIFYPYSNIALTPFYPYSNIALTPFIPFGLHTDYIYSRKYQIATINKFYIETSINLAYNRFHLSRITKKNGKHRYYIAEEIWDVREIDTGFEVLEDNFCKFISKFISTNLDVALLEFALLLEIMNNTKN